MATDRRRIPLIPLILFAAILASCGGSAADTAKGMNAGLNALTDAVDPAYGLAVQACEARADQIIEREGSTYAQDRAEMDALQRRCDAAFARFEEIRSAQIAARAAIDSEQLAEAYSAFARVRELWASLSELLGARAPTSPPELPGFQESPYRPDAGAQAQDGGTSR